MKESYNEGVASHIGPESCFGDPRGRGEALTGGPIELRKIPFPGGRASGLARRQNMAS
jgi:hypothetical protein